MRHVQLYATDLCLSRLSFGTASLHHLASGRERQRLLSAALDHGFTHFDSAPYYGYGIAELEIGKFIRERRGAVTVATKVGLYAPAGSHPNIISTWFRKAAGRVLPGLSRPIADWSIVRAKASLRLSLRRLGTDYVDLLLLHEPDANALDSDVFLEWLERENASGSIRAWGLAGPVARAAPWLSHPLGAVLQVQDSLSVREADAITAGGRPLQLTYGYLSSRVDARDAEAAEQVIERALRRNTTGSVLVSTRRLAHLRTLAACADNDNS